MGTARDFLAKCRERKREKEKADRWLDDAWNSLLPDERKQMCKQGVKDFIKSVLLGR